MIDFVKIKVCNSVATKWLGCSLLNFSTQVSTSTGAIISKQKTAEYKGLTFTISYTDTSHTIVTALELKGSLHIYYNNCKGNKNGNSDDYTFLQLVETIKEIEQKFYINAKTSTLHNIEIAVNIHSPITAKELLNNIVALKSFEIEKLNKVGIQIVAKQWRFKLYDKGKQANLKDVKNLVRLEIHYNRMETLQAKHKKYNIVTLSDLQDIEKVSPLISEIIKKWNALIYYDNSIKIKYLSVSKQKRVLYYQIPKKWQGFNRMQRMRAKKRFSELMRLHGSTTQQEIGVLITAKWQELTAEKCIRFDRVKNENEQQKNVYVLTRIMCSQNVTKPPKKNDTIIYPKNPKKATEKKRVCIVCKNSISHKKANAKFCSKKCNNQHHGKMRTKKRQQERTTEKKNLDKLILLIEKGKMWLMISYKTDNGIYTDTLHQKEIHTSSDWVRSVQKVLVTEYRKNGKPIILKSYRARRLVKLINDRNTKNDDQRRKKENRNIKK